MRLHLPSCLQSALCGVAAAAALTVTPAFAQVSIEAIPDSVLRPYSIRDGSPALRDAATARSVPSIPVSGPRLRDYSWLGGAVQVESPRAAYDGTYTRPKLMVGVPSEAMKGWMNAAGLSAERCLLPMVRARARVNADGEANGTLWLYARCNFQ
jgi:hypothetical protein